MTRPCKDAEWCRILFPCRDRKHDKPLGEGKGSVSSRGRLDGAPFYFADSIIITGVNPLKSLLYCAVCSTSLKDTASAFEPGYTATATAIGG